MAIEDYYKAQKLGLKEYKTQTAKNEPPYLPVLDDILKSYDIETRTDLGLIDIPLDLIVGTSTGGRTVSFARNFMPILDEESEFAVKWGILIDQLTLEGQRDAIKALEFLGKYYVIEGNKRVSVSKYLNNVSLFGTVTRIVPKDNGSKEVQINNEYIKFYKLNKINYLTFSKPGKFPRLLKELHLAPDYVWTEDECLSFKSRYLIFSKEFIKLGGNKLNITPADAFLAYLNIYEYEEISKLPLDDLKKNIKKMWDEFLMLEEDKTVGLVLDPKAEIKKPSIITKMIKPIPTKLKAAFIFDKAPMYSAWSYAHELGRLHVETVFGDKVKTKRFDSINSSDEDQILATLEQAISEGADVIFTTTPTFRTACLKAAVTHPEVKILNCCLNASHRYIRTFYARMYEAKFLIGAIAGALADNNKIGYIADYPLFGTPASINAFALGAKMVNPRAKIYLEWSSIKDHDYKKTFRENDIYLISDKDMTTPETQTRAFGLYYMDENDVPVNIAMPVWNWGVFYETILNQIFSGTWKTDEEVSSQAVNYWWGMSTGIIDVICSKKLPVGTTRLVDLLKKTIATGDFNPFSGILYSQKGTVSPSEYDTLRPEDLIAMDWLAENVIGSLPDVNSLTDEARRVIKFQGVIGKEEV